MFEITSAQRLLNAMICHQSKFRVINNVSEWLVMFCRLANDPPTTILFVIWPRGMNGTQNISNHMVGLCIYCIITHGSNNNKVFCVYYHYGLCVNCAMSSGQTSSCLIPHRFAHVLCADFSMSYVQSVEQPARLRLAWYLFPSTICMCMCKCNTTA